jgi:acetyl esterase/lipase
MTIRDTSRRALRAVGAAATLLACVGCGASSSGVEDSGASPAGTGGRLNLGAAGAGGAAGHPAAPGGTSGNAAGASGAGEAGSAGGPGAASGGRSGTGAGGAAGGGGLAVGTGGSTATSGQGGSVPLPAPVSDTSSKLGISEPGSGYHVEGNIPYGPLTMQRLDVMYPTTAGPKGTVTLPGVIMFHGGGWIDNRPQALKASMVSFFDRFLAHGFVVCNVEYRLADGTANGATAPAADEDALLAAKWFWSYLDYYHVDRTKYVVTGASAGGQLALMVGMATAVPDLGPTNPNDFKIAAIVNGYGPSDVTDLLARKISWAEQWLPASTPNRDALAKELSPITYVRMNIPPLITVQGKNDTTVPTSESQALYDALTAVGADTALHFVTGAGHGFSTPASAWPDAEAAMFGFLTGHGIGK